MRSACVNTVRAFVVLLALAGLAVAQRVAATQEVRLSFVEQGWQPSPIERLHGGVFFRVVVNGRAVRALLDTGAERSVIDATLARALALPQGADAGLRTRHGTLATTLVRGVKVEVPHQIAFAADVAGTDLAPLSRVLGQRIGFVLGRDYLAHLACYVDQRNARLYLRRSGAITPNKPGIAIPLRSDNTVAATVDGTPVRLALDLGFNGTVKLSEDAWARAIRPGGATVRTSDVDGGGREGATVLTPGADVRIGGLRLTMPVATQHGDMAGADGEVGMGLLRHYNMLVDAPRGQMLLIPLDPAATRIGYTS